jgi:hypothetical protein
MNCMKFYVLYPEVPGGFGRKTIFNGSVQPPLVLSLHYEFEGWNGDELVTTFPVLLVSERVADALKTAEIGGCTFEPAEISKSEQFELLRPETQLPVFRWMKVTGKAGKDEIGLSAQSSLVVSERVLNLLKTFALNHCDIRDADQEPDPKELLRQELERVRAKVKRDFPRKVNEDS